ncbi:MAG: hypothetical protein E5Y63_29235 [Mesorhizobium sp.]|nr:MAG: hypothetical protein E5Y63_29235 [Mesorhizobium sp.]
MKLVRLNRTFLKRVAFDRPLATRFRLLFMHVVIAEPLHTFARHALVRAVSGAHHGSGRQTQHYALAGIGGGGRRCGRRRRICFGE